MKRSGTVYPLSGLALAKDLNNAWEKGWLDEFYGDYFLIKVIEGRLSEYPNFYQLPAGVHMLFCSDIVDLL